MVRTLIGMGLFCQNFKVIKIMEGKSFALGVSVNVVLDLVKCSRYWGEFRQRILNKKI